MKKIGPAIFLLFFIQTARAQYVNDNKLYRNISWAKLCQELQGQKDYLLLDVRSKGEFADTSGSPNYNMGHLNGAINIPVNELETRLPELQNDKNKTIYVYCSHSQRSRRVSKLLSEKGFTKVVNIDGGMTQLNLEMNRSAACSKSIYATSNGYRLLGPSDVCQLLSGNKKVFILDIRTDSVFRGISTSEKLNAFGHFKNAVNIPMGTLEANTVKLPLNGPVLIVDDYGDRSPVAAKQLADNGFKNISVLFNGMDMWHGLGKNRLACKTDLVTGSAAYGMIATEDLAGWMKQQKDIIIIDIRNAESWQNKSKDYWRNIGHIKNAINIPFAALQEKMNDLAADKGKPVLLYDFGSSAEVFAAAKMLSQNGFSNVRVLLNGLFNIRWTAANIEGHSGLKDLVEGVPVENL